MSRASEPIAVSPASVERRILLLRGRRVMLDRDLAELYEVPVKVLNQAVKRNRDRFPDDFMFQLTIEETTLARSPYVTYDDPGAPSSRSQIVTLKRGRNIKYAAYAFTQEGIAMLSSVLRSGRAIRVNVEIMRAFVRLRQILASHADLARKLEALEGKYDAQFKVVFDAIRQLMQRPKPEPEASKRKIGFQVREPFVPPYGASVRKVRGEKRKRALSHDESRIAGEGQK